MKQWNLVYERQSKDSLWGALLKARQIENPGQFFAQAELSDLHDPFLFPDMERAVERCQKAIHGRERLVVYGDYDVDGTSGAAILIHTLRLLGAEVSYRIPHRMKDGYGLHTHLIEELLPHDVKLIITVDCGISCAPEVAFAREQGVDVIITDHHSIPEQTPEALALLHPQIGNYPFKHLAGSAVAFKLASALLMRAGREDFIPALLDLASLGTVADCVPLHGENRAIVKLGLKQLAQTQWEGLRAILKRSGADQRPLNSDTIGFQIGPRINASGRMDSPYWALQALISQGEEALEKTETLERLNQERRELTEAVMQEAEAQIDPNADLLIAAGDWSSGVVGLIAGRLQEKYGKPCFILQDRGETMVGSARSLPGFHAVRALDAAAEHLSNYGGHEQAAGFNLPADQYPHLKAALLKHAHDTFKENPIQPRIDIDFALQAEDLQVDHIRQLEGFAPFGIGNPRPKFLMDKIKVLETRPVGHDKSHLQFKVDFEGRAVQGIAFRRAPEAEALQNANQLVAELSINEWQGKETPQIQLTDFRQI